MAGTYKSSKQQLYKSQFVISLALLYWQFETDAGTLTYIHTGKQTFYLPFSSYVKATPHPLPCQYTPTYI